MALTDLSPSQILGKIRYDPLSKKGSVLDVIQLVTGCGQKHTSRELARILDMYPDVRPKLMDMKFEGYKQKPTKAAHLATLIEIAWLCPGKHAKEFRRTGAVTLCRALGGDLSLIDEIRQRRIEVTEGEQDALLAGTGVTTAEANGMAVDVRRLDMEERKLALREQQVHAEIQERRVALLRDAVAYLQTRAHTVDDVRHKLYLEDGAKNMERMYVETLSGKRQAIESTAEHVPITIAMVAEQMGYNVTRDNRSQLGKLVARMYREANGGAGPPKHEQYVDGGVQRVNSYFEKDRRILESAVRDFFG